MSAIEEWQSGNKRYLAAALDWLTLRLEWYVGDRQGLISVPPVVPSTTAPVPRSGGLNWFGRPQPPPAGEPLLLPPPEPYRVTEAEVAAAFDAMRAAEAIEPPPALLQLAERLNLSRFEQEVLLLCAAPELSRDLLKLYALAQQDEQMAYPTFDLALSLFEDSAWGALSPTGGLRAWHLIEIAQSAGQPLALSPLRADERIASYLKGLNYLDDRLSPLLTPLGVEADQLDIAPSQREVVESILYRWSQPSASPYLPVAQLIGADVASKQLVAWHTAAELGRQLYRMPAEFLPSHTGDLEDIARLWHRESKLLKVALYVDAEEIDGGAAGDNLAPRVGRFLARSDGVLFLGTRDIWPSMSRSQVAVEVPRPTRAEQLAVWADALGPGGETIAAELAGQFNLSLALIQQIARAGLAESYEDSNELRMHLWDACLAGTRPRMDALAQRIDAKATFEAIVLPDAETKLLHQIADQVGQRTRVYEQWGFGQTMSRGWGISALFAGESGTGKTMAAEVLANHLHLNLYRIDLSGVVSKYIGETEKNLRRLFDAAEDGGAILFFDEADALFGKRSEVKDSHDRYANIEINYLLQRMEAYRGLAILATNMKSALDIAFLRRLRFIVNFPFPSFEERKRIWQKVFPDRTPKRKNLDYERLARLPATGGMILNIALNATFAAAHAGGDVSMRLIMDAARAEFQKYERPIPEREFVVAEDEGAPDTPAPKRVSA